MLWLTVGIGATSDSWNSVAKFHESYQTFSHGFVDGQGPDRNQGRSNGRFLISKNPVCSAQIFEKSNSGFEITDFYFDFRPGAFLLKNLGSTSKIFRDSGFGAKIF